LRILRTEIEDDDGLGGHPLVWQGASPVCKPNPDFSRCGFLGDFHSLELICKVLKIKKVGGLSHHSFTVSRYMGGGGVPEKRGTGIRGQEQPAFSVPVHSSTVRAGRK
jgi:hypothetical protein